MNFLLHNRIEISNGKDEVYFYNNMLDSVLDQIRLKKSFNNFIALGTGNDRNLSETTYKLDEFLKIYKLDCEYLQDDINKGNLYIKKTAFLDGKILTEAGLTDSMASNPTIFNYFQFEVDNEVGISKQRGVPLVISVYIYLGISKYPDYDGLLTSGKNKFIDFLLGNGLENDIFCARGNLLAGNNSMINREKVDTQKYPCTMDISISSGLLDITFIGNLGLGVATEVIMLVGDEPFARILTVSSNNMSLLNDDFSVKSNKVVDVDCNVSEIVSVKNNTTQNFEQNYFSYNFASKFGDKINLPFHNLFDNNTSRFVSKDGKIIFFVVDDKVYGYNNENYLVEELNTSAISVQNIVNIVAIDKFVFVVSKNAPYLFAYKLDNSNTFLECDIDFTNFDKESIISNIFKCDLTYSLGSKLMFAVIDRSSYYGWTFYFDYDSQNNEFTFDSYICSQFRFNYVLAMSSTEYSDAMTIFLKGDELSYLCKIVYHYSDKTIQDIYSTLAYYLTCDTKEIYTYGRAIIVEQLSSPKIWIYLYPEIKKIDLDISGTEVDDVISHNLKYLAQKFDDGSYKFYNLIGYDTPTEFENGLLQEIDKDEILDIVFLNDVMLLFLDNDEQKIVAISLFENKTCIENVSSNDDTYNITYNKFNIAGEDNKRVVANFMIRMIL